MKSKSARIIFTIAAMACVIAGSAAPLFADDADTIAILTTGAWTFHGTNKNWSYVAVFKPDKTVSIKKDDGSTMELTWKMNNKYVGIFFSNYQDVLVLPLNPRGTPGLGRGEDKFNAIKVGYEPPADPASPASASPGATPDYFGESTGGTANSTPAPASALAPGLTPEESAKLQESASDMVKTYRNSLVFVTGKEGSGSGFIATISGGNFLVTNAHVAAGISGAAFKTLDGTVVQGGAASVAVGHDIFCMVMPAGGKPFEIMQNVDENAAIGDYVVVLGNAEGQGVINTIIGKIVGIGPDRVEIDAPFVHGNSGSPIIHLKTGKVIGVATYCKITQYDEMTNKKSAEPVIRRFGYRIDSVKKWQNVDWRSFYAQAAEMKSIDTLTEELANLYRDLAQNGAITGEYTNPAIKTRIDQWIAERSHGLSIADEKDANANFLSFLKVACQTDVTAARQQITYDYFQHGLSVGLSDEQEARDEISKAFDDIIKGIRR